MARSRPGPGRHSLPPVGRAAPPVASGVGLGGGEGAGCVLSIFGLLFWHGVVS